MDFQQAESKFKQLKGGFEAGELTETEFKAQLEELMVQDEAGTWWMIGYETEQWYRYDGEKWVQIDPPNILSKKLKFILPSGLKLDEMKRKINDFRGIVNKFPGGISRQIILIIAMLIIGLTLYGGYSIGKKYAHEPMPSITEFTAQDHSDTATVIFINTPTFTKQPSQTPQPSPTLIAESIAYIDVNQAQMYQGPGLEYYFVDQALYSKDEKLIVIAVDSSGFWFLCEATDGTMGWLYLDWIRISFDAEIIPTASFIPPVPPTPTRKPKPTKQPPPPTGASVIAP